MSLGGQHRDAGADYLITTSSRFALVKFMDIERNLTNAERLTRTPNYLRHRKFEEFIND